MHKKKKLQRESIAERNAENGGREAADFPQERLVILLYHLFFKSASAAERCGGDKSHLPADFLFSEPKNEIVPLNY